MRCCSKNCKKIEVSEPYIGLCQTALTEPFCENSERLKDITKDIKKLLSQEKLYQKCFPS